MWTSLGGFCGFGGPNFALVWDGMNGKFWSLASGYGRLGYSAGGVVEWEEVQPRGVRTCEMDEAALLSLFVHGC